MAQYPHQNFSAMRQDAIRRSREMQRRAVPPPMPTQPAESAAENHPASHVAASDKSLTGQPFLTKELQSLLSDWDGERIALLALLFFLYKEGTDPKLLLALAYIIL